MRISLVTLAVAIGTVFGMSSDAVAAPKQSVAKIYFSDHTRTTSVGYYTLSCDTQVEFEGVQTPYYTLNYYDCPDYTFSFCKTCTEAGSLHCTKEGGCVTVQGTTCTPSQLCAQ